MVFDQNKSPGFCGIGDPTGSVGDYQRLDTQKLHNHNRICGLPHFPPFVEMESSVHQKYGDAADIAADKFPFLIIHCGYREVWNLRIRDYDPVFALFRNRIEPGPQDHRCFRLSLSDSIPDEFRALPVSLYSRSVDHFLFLPYCYGPINSL